MAFTGKTVANTFKDILQMDNSNSGIGTSVKVVKDGIGNQSALYISDDIVRIAPENDDTTGTLEVKDKDGDTKFVVDSTNDLVKALGHIVNTNIQDFYIVHSASIPNATDNWVLVVVVELNQGQFFKVELVVLLLHLLRFRQLLTLSYLITFMFLLT